MSTIANSKWSTLVCITVYIFPLILIFGLVWTDTTGNADTLIFFIYFVANTIVSAIALYFVVDFKSKLGEF